MKIDVQLDAADEVRTKLQRIGQQAAARALAATAEDAEDYVGREAGQHTKTGALFRSVGKRRDGDGWVIEHDTQVALHALFVHWGTKPHEIRPRRKKALRWAAGGAFAFARGVKHPGYRGDAWLVRAAARAPLDFARHVDAVIARIEKEG